MLRDIDSFSQKYISILKVAMNIVTDAITNVTYPFQQLYLEDF